MDPTQPALPMSSNEFDPRQHRAVTVRAAAARKVSARATRARVVRAGAVRRLVSRLAATIHQAFTSMGCEAADSFRRRGCEEGRRGCGDKGKR
jgi:hypothetical protein